MPHDPNATRTQQPSPPTAAYDTALNAGLAAAFGRDATPGGWSQPPLLRDDPSEHAPLVQPSSAEMPRGAGSRYQLLGEIARGGMGVVLKGRDPDLGRDLAFKVLRHELSGKSAAEQRFVEEAQVGGQLQHPGIVPVYDIGRFGDGRPYFAMKLVKGRTLADLLAERTDPTVERGRYLRHFLQVCNTLAYAHSKGVLHRDMKPSNVMVGAFDEVLVMDWGLAKVLARGGVADEAKASRASEPAEVLTEIKTARFGSGSETAAGSVLGTPAFMPPEQAGGEIDKLDERADVFGLGAVLCVILTGKPPYISESGDALRLMAVRGQLDDCFSRLDACGADAELVGICKRSLSAERDERPRHAGEVAAAIAAYLAGVEERAKQAEMERAASVAREAEGRKRRRVQLALAAVVLLMVVGGGGAGWWMDRQAADRRREREVAVATARLIVETALSRAEAALAAGALPDADAALARADEGFAGLDAPDLRDRQSALTRDRDLARELEVIAEERWMVSRSDTRYEPTRPKQRYPEAFRRYGLRIGEEPPDATAARVRRSPVSEAILAGLDDWFFQEPARPGLQALLEQADPDPFRSAVRSAVAAGDRSRLQKLASEADGASLPPRFAITLGLEGDLSINDPVRASLRILKAAWSAHPTSYPLTMAICIRLFGLTCGGLGEEEDVREMPGWCRTAIALRPTSGLAYYYLARTADSLSYPPFVIAALRQSIHLAPRFTTARSRLAFLLAMKAENAVRAGEAPDWSEALSEAREALRLDPANLPARVVLFRYYEQTADWAGAAVEYPRVLALVIDSYNLKEMYVSGCDNSVAAVMLAHNRFLENLIEKAGPRVAYDLHKEVIRVGGTRIPYPMSTNLTYREGVGAAILLGTGRAAGGPPTDRPAYLQDARNWLALEMANVKQYIGEQGNKRWNAHDVMISWLGEPLFAAVRDPEKLAVLPADEQAAWAKLWADVRKLRDETAREPAPFPRPMPMPAVPAPPMRPAR